MSLTTRHPDHPLLVTFHFISIIIRMCFLEQNVIFWKECPHLVTPFDLEAVLTVIDPVPGE